MINRPIRIDYRLYVEDCNIRFFRLAFNDDRFLCNANFLCGYIFLSIAKIRKILILGRTKRGSKESLAQNWKAIPKAKYQ